MNLLAASNKTIMNLPTGETVGPTIMALVLEDGKIFSFDNDQWVRTNAEPTNAVAVAIGPAGFWCLDKDGNVYLWNNDPAKSAWAKEIGVTGVTTLSCDAKGNLWCIDSKGEISMNPIQFVGHGSVSGKPFEMGGWSKATLPLAPLTGEIGTWVYVVKAGDKLGKIVPTEYKVNGKHNIERITKEIIRLNKLKNEDAIKTGQKLTMPALSYR